MKSRTLLLLNSMLLLFAGIKAEAQVAVTNQGTLYVSGSSDILYVNGSFDNQSTAVITNNGSLYILGDLNNDQAGMATGTGTLLLQGTSAQNVNGSQAFYTYNLTSNNSNGITLNNDLSVANLHAFSSGLITTSSSNFLIYQSGATYSGDNDANHVNGWVKKIGTQDFDFPVGNTTMERKAGIRGLSTASDFQCHYYQTTPNLNLHNGNLAIIDPNEYWYIDKNSGGTAKVYLTWDVTKAPLGIGTTLLSSVQIAHFTSGKWNGENQTATTGLLSLSGSITSNSLSTFSPFTLGSNINVLPVTYLYFTATPQNGKSKLDWATGSENANDHFEVQRSVDQENWTYITTVASSGMKTGGTYEAFDSEPESGFDFYIIKQVNQDGTFSYSNIAYCKFSKNSLAAENAADEDEKVELLNSTNSPSLKITTPADWTTSHYTLEIYNLSGQLVKDVKSTDVDGGGEQVMSMDLGYLERGMYIAVLSNTTQKRKKTFKVL